MARLGNCGRDSETSRLGNYSHDSEPTHLTKKLQIWIASNLIINAATCLQVDGVVGLAGLAGPRLPAWAALDKWLG